jgi:hypothetical protein
MSGSCCGGSSKSEPAKVALTAAPQVTEDAAEQPAANTKANGCCSEKPAKSEKRGCCC